MAELPAFDPEYALTAQHLRQLEKSTGYGAVAAPESPDRASSPKQRKAAMEIACLQGTIGRLAATKLEHPPYGLVRPELRTMELLTPDLRLVTGNFMDEKDSREIVRASPLKVLHALSDLRLQMLMNAEYCRLAEERAEEFMEYEEASQQYAEQLMRKTMVGKNVFLTAATNAKRSEFIVLKQILRQWRRKFGRMPTREEFEHVAAESAELLVTLASTHLAVFRPINELLVMTCTVADVRDAFHDLMQKDGNGQLVIRSDILAKHRIENDLDRTRTMCLALLARDAHGKSLLEHSYCESVELTADAIYGSDDPEARAAAFEQELLPSSSIHMYTRLLLVDDEKD